MTEQLEFLEALGVTVDGVPVDQAFTTAAIESTLVSNPPGTNNYHWGNIIRSMTPETIEAEPASVQQATFNGRALQDLQNSGRQLEISVEEQASRAETMILEDMDESELNEDQWRRLQPPEVLLLGVEEHEDYGEYEDESESSMADSEDGYSDPEKILCQSDQDFPRRGHLFLVKWKNCSILRSSWEWESESFEDAFDDRPQFQNFLKLPHAIRLEWESRKQRVARGEEEKFDVHNWHNCVTQENLLRNQRRNLRRWKRKLEGIRRVLDAQRMDADAEWHGQMVRRMEKEDRLDKEKEEREKRKAEVERKRARKNGDEEMEDVSVKRTA